MAKKYALDRSRIDEWALMNSVSNCNAAAALALAPTTTENTLSDKRSRLICCLARIVLLTRPAVAVGRVGTRFSLWRDRHCVALNLSRFVCPRKEPYQSFLLLPAHRIVSTPLTVEVTLEPSIGVQAILENGNGNGERMTLSNLHIDRNHIDGAILHQTELRGWQSPISALSVSANEKLICAQKKRGREREVNASASTGDRRVRAVARFHRPTFTREDIRSSRVSLPRFVSFLRRRRSFFSSSPDTFTTHRLPLCRDEAARADCIHSV